MLYELENITPGTFGERIARWLASKIIGLKEKLGMSLASQEQTFPEDIAKLAAQELHAPVKKSYPRRKIITNHIDEIHSSDLAEMTADNGL